MGVVGAVVDAAIGWLVQNILESLFTGQMKAWSHGVGLAEDVETLESEMKRVQVVLAAADGRTIRNKPLAGYLDDLKDLLYDAEDVMDELDYYRLQQQIEQGEGFTDSDRGCISSSTASFSTATQVLSWFSRDKKRKREEESTYNKPDIYDRIKEITNHLRKCVNSVRELLQLEISDPIAGANQSQCVAMARNARLTSSVPTEDKLYGRDAERDKIIELLISGKSREPNVLPIVGIGGVGKTTLARFIYCDQRIKDHFDLRMWVCVSTNFDKVRLTCEILDYVCTHRQQYGETTNFSLLQEVLVKSIENKRFLLVLDDIWEENDKSGWDRLLAPLKGNHVPGCMILATTRRPSVAKMIGTMDPFQLNGLDEKEFWLFFKACAFGSENNEGHPSLQSIGQQIVKALKGCPLAARSVGALLNRNHSYEHWRTVQNKWKSLQDTNNILHILKLSYDFLPVHLQRCFSYCSLFPDDYKFNEEILVRTWISQTFVQCEETGKQYLDNLVDLGFFQKIDSQYFFEMKAGLHYVMHDLMHELAQMVSLNECATINGFGNEAIQPSTRHLSIITTAYDRDENCSFPFQKFENALRNIGSSKKLRTLMVFGRSRESLLSSIHTLCNQSKSLRVVSIFGTHDSINSTLNLLNPYHLRFIEFRDVFLEILRSEKDISLPQALTKFYHLQFLYASGASNISVPTGMNNLINLRNLVADKKMHLEIAGVGKLTSLQELEFKVRNVSDFEIEQLQPLTELVNLGISQLENVKTKEEASAARLMDKKYLEVLSLSWDDIMGIESCTGRTKDVLEGLQPYENLKSLRITGYNGAAPTWLSSNVSVKYLQILHLENCRFWQNFPAPKMLPFLRKLKLIKIWNLMEISIPSLEELVLIEMPILEKCVGAYGMELTSHLMVMIIKGCPQLNEFTPFHSYSSFQSEQQSWFPFLRKLTICYCSQIIKWEILPLGGLWALKELKLIDLHLVKEVSVPSLEELVLIRMPSLERCSGLTDPPFLPSQDQPNVCLSSLLRLTIHDCPTLMVTCPLPPSPHVWDVSIQGKSSINISDNCLIIESNELSVLDDKIIAFHNLRSTTEVTIRNCPKLISILHEGFRQLNGLHSLYISDCPNLLKPPITLEVTSDKSTYGNILVLPYLKYLDISSCGIAGGWLSKMLPHLTSLEVLSLDDCPQIKQLLSIQPTETEGCNSLASDGVLSAQEQMILKVPSNILSSLKELSISRCVDLEFYGDKGGFGGFTTLEKLGIDRCPNLVPLLVCGSKDSNSGSFNVPLLPMSLKELRIYGSPKLVSLLVRDTEDVLPLSIERLYLYDLPENLQSYTPKGLSCLKELSLQNSLSLKCVQLHPCMVLEKLQIRGCEWLGALEGLQFLTSLRSLALKMNPELSAAWDRHPKMPDQGQGGNQMGLLPPSIKELDIENLTDNVQSRLLTCLPAITKLVLHASPELTSLQLGCCVALEDLEIRHCESLAFIDGFQSVRNLRCLRVAASSGLLRWMELLFQQQGVSEVLSRLKKLIIIGDASVLTTSLCQQLTSLEVLEFWGEGTSSMVSLTEEQERALQLLTSITELTFCDYLNLLSLPANLRSLVSLSSLTIFSCPCILALPEVATSCTIYLPKYGEEPTTRCQEMCNEEGR